MKRIGRNDPCPCGSTKKYKNCCINEDNSNNIVRIGTPNPADLIHDQINQLQWYQPMHAEVAKAFVSAFLNVYAVDSILNTIFLWHDFCSYHQPQVRKPESIVAAMEYIFTSQTQSQKVVASKHQVSLATMNKWITDIRDFIYRKQDELSTGGDDPKLAAQTYLKQAHATNDSQKRIQLAQKAIQLDKHCVDAHLVLIHETSKDLFHSIYRTQKLVYLAEKWLGGESFFEENAEHFWLHPETKPYMRARFELAKMLLHCEMTQDAIDEFHELIKLNPMDQQGVRYHLISALLIERDVEAFEMLIQVYREESTHFVYAKLVAAYLKHGIGAHLKPQLKNAIKANRHVPALLADLTRIVESEITEYFRPGEKNEAELYLYESFMMWDAYPELMHWVMKNG